MAPPVDVPVSDVPTEDVESGDIISIGGVIYVTVMLTLLTFVFLMICVKWSSIGQKTRNPQQRRMYAGSRARPSLSTHEPTIYVSPSNLPPPPKYECMAPPSYEEVVGVHYPNLQAQQPIAQPITAALAQSTQPNNSNRTNDSITITNDSVPTSNNSEIRPNNDTTVVTVNERQTVISS